jgi:hypothetical protein
MARIVARLVAWTVTSVPLGPPGREWSEDDRMVARVVGDSALVRLADASFGAWTRAGQSSAVANLVTTTMPGAAAGRVQWWGYVILAAVVTRVALIGPSLFAGPVPSAIGWTVLVPAGLLGVARPAAVVAAWSTFRGRWAARATRPASRRAGPTPA